MERFLEAEIQKRRRRMLGLPTRLDESAGIERGKAFRDTCPALIHSFVGEGLSQRRQACFEAVHILNPDFNPLPKISSSVRQTTQVHHRIGKIAQEHQVTRGGISLLSS